MPALEEFPETCRQSIKTIADALTTDYDTAYAIICLEALLWDLYPSDTMIVSMVLRDKDRAEQTVS